MLASVIAALSSQGAMADAHGGEPALAIERGTSALQWGACPPIFAAGCEIAVLHGDPARPNADVFLRVPGGYDMPAHFHTSAERMVLIAGELEVTYLGQPATVLRAGIYAYGPAGRPHIGRCLSDDACVLFIAFEGAVDALPYEGALR
jgi:hypothetical protein